MALGRGRLPSGMRTGKPSDWTRRVLVAGLGVVVVGSALAMTRRDDFAFFDPIIDVRSIIRQHAFAPPEDAALQQAAIEGMLDALDDPYAVYVPAEENEAFEKDLTGEYVGIGAEVMVRDGVFTIVTPLDGSPALDAGLMADDKVIQIDGEPTAGLSVDACIARLKGDAGTGVTLTVDRGGSEVLVRVTRDVIRTPVVRGFHRGAGEDAPWRYIIDAERRVAYVRLAQFTPASASALAAALEDAEREAGGALGGLVLDLRGNPGGLLDQAIEMADLFLSSGDIVSTRGREGGNAPARRAAAARQESDHDYPVALLINGQSASASEVLAGALLENDRAVAVGTRTFGKGSVQSVRPLSGAAAGAVLKLTEERYYLPSGRSIQREDDAAAWGVDPSPGCYVSMTDDETRAMLTVRREGEIIGPGSGDAGERWSTPAMIAAELKDPQLARAFEVVRARIDGGAWPTDGADAPASEASAVGELVTARRGRERLLRELTRVEARIAALEAAVVDEAAVQAAAVDLLPDDRELVGGELIVRDAGGDEVARLRITGENLERWLIDAGVEPLRDEP